LARGEPPPGKIRKDSVDRQPDWPDDLSGIIYIDHFGNAMTGLRMAMLPGGAKLAVAGQRLEPARTFSDRPRGVAFYYENANGLVEIAVNQGRADRDLGLSVGSPVKIVS
jgi:S-adenosylmethionine hydrolase